jgi:hypothetical protein
MSIGLPVYLSLFIYVFMGLSIFIGYSSLQGFIPKWFSWEVFNEALVNYG